ncbi:hypothetical protein HYX18_04735 [Candidatus Woesearchaeota archaeon]|nr:hypothetical protein [Candidatus Woesearchaeota archaeon]
MKLQQINPQTLDEIDLSDIKDYPPIDSGIEKLVKALRGIGLLTVASCEGHLTQDKHPYPWVNLSLHPEIKKSMLEIIQLYNSQSEISWTIDHCAIKPLESAYNESELKKLQQNSESLAIFLFNNYVKFFSAY